MFRNFRDAPHPQHQWAAGHWYTFILYMSMKFESNLYSGCFIYHKTHIFNKNGIFKMDASQIVVVLNVKNKELCLKFEGI